MHALRCMLARAYTCMHGARIILFCCRYDGAHDLVHDHGLHALVHTTGCSFHARNTPAAAPSSAPGSRKVHPSRYRRSSDRMSSATSSLNATGEKPADRMRRAHDAPVSRLSTDSDAGQATRSTMARPAALSRASLSLLALGKLSSRESMYAEKKRRPSVNTFMNAASASASPADDDDGSDAATRSASSSTTVTTRGSRRRSEATNASRRRAPPGATPRSALTQLIASAVAAPPSRRPRPRPSRSSPARSPAWCTARKLKGTPMRRANFSRRCAISRITRCAAADDGTPAVGTTVVMDRWGVSSDDLVASASSSVGHCVQKVLLRSRMCSRGGCCEEEDEEAAAAAAASRNDSSMAPLAATWPKDAQGLSSWNLSAVRRVESKDVFRSDAAASVRSVRGPEVVRRAKRPWRK
uniref:Uncharacterized protein n=1 Tax=Zea mays TaxID=4577 RepID=A0A804LM65_MAIZE